MLIAESEVCRQTLRLELQNLRLFSIKTKQRIGTFGLPKRTWMLAAAGLFSLWTRRRQRRLSIWRLGGMSVLGWQLVQRMAPYCSGLVGWSRRRRARESHRPHHRLWHKKDMSAA